MISISNFLTELALFIRKKRPMNNTNIACENQMHEERRIRKEKLSLIRNEIRNRVKRQIEIKKLLSQKHDENSPELQRERYTNRFGISTLHDLSHRLRSCKHHHGDISDSQIEWMKKQIGI